MKKNQKGYTLAEVIITIGIVGVIAAITIPSLYSLKNNTYEPAANRTRMLLQQSLIKVIDLANSNVRDTSAITTLGAIRVSDITGQNDNTNLVSNGALNLFNNSICASEMEIHQITANERQAYLNSANIMERQGDQEIVTRLTVRYPRLNNSQIYKINKTNSYIIIEPFCQIGNNNDVNMNFNSEHAIITRVFIDANGQQGKNRLDEDLFVYGLGNDGYLYSSDTTECQNFNGGCRLQ